MILTWVSGFDNAALVLTVTAGGIVGLGLDCITTYVFGAIATPYAL